MSHRRPPRVATPASAEREHRRRRARLRGAAGRRRRRASGLGRAGGDRGALRCRGRRRVRAAAAHGSGVSGRPAPARPAPGRLVGVGARAVRGRDVHDQPVPAADAGRRRGDRRVAAALRPAVGPVLPALRVARRRSIVVMRLAFWVFFGGWTGGRVLLDLPSIPLPDWVAGITLLGPLYAEALLFALYDGLRLATIVICVGAANSLANPKRLLRSVPPALYEIGTALVVAVTVLPQFADSARRVRAAQSLRAGDTAPGAAAAPVPGAGARGRARALAGPGGRHGHPRLRARVRRDPGPAADHRSVDAGRSRRHLRRHLRRARRHRAPGARPADAGARGRRRGGGAAHRRAAGSSGPATGRTRGAGPSSRWSASGVVVGALGWWIGQQPARGGLPGARRDADGQCRWRCCWPSSPCSARWPRRPPGSAVAA